MKRTWLPLVPLFGLGVSWVLASGCATDAAPPEDEDSGVTPPTDAARDGTTTTDARPPGVDSSVRDSAVPDGAKTDASADARADATPTDSGIVANPGELVDPTAPKTGDVCPTGVPEFDSISRRCGKCGTQRALCEAGRVVGTYGPCTAEKTGDVCYPNAVEVGVECGLCGSQVRKCDLTCAWSTGVCLGEVANGCVKNEVTYIEGVCPAIEQARKQSCSNACVRGVPEACAAQAPDTLAGPQTAGGMVSGVFSLSSLRTIPRLNSGSCPAAASTINVGYHYARITNPGAESINVTVSQSAPPVGTKVNTYIAAYVGLSAPPADAAARLACSQQVRDTPESITLNIPAGQSAYILSMAAAANSSSRFELTVETNFVGAEVAPAVDTDVILDPVNGNTVTAPVTFVATQVLERVSTGTCPQTIATTKPAYRYIRVTNNSATARLADVSLATGLDTVIGVYPGPTPPISTDRPACVGSINDFCSGVTNANSCLTGVSIPAMGSIIVYASGYSLTSGSTTFSATTRN